MKFAKLATPGHELPRLDLPISIFIARAIQCKIAKWKAAEVEPFSRDLLLVLVSDRRRIDYLWVAVDARCWMLCWWFITWLSPCAKRKIANRVSGLNHHRLILMKRWMEDWISTSSVPVIGGEISSQNRYLTNLPAWACNITPFSSQQLMPGWVVMLEEEFCGGLVCANWGETCSWFCHFLQ